MAAHRRMDGLVTCRACTLRSAPGPTLGNEYGKTLLFYLYPNIRHFLQILKSQDMRLKILSALIKTQKVSSNVFIIRSRRSHSVSGLFLLVDFHVCSSVYSGEK